MPDDDDRAERYGSELRKDNVSVQLPFVSAVHTPGLPQVVRHPAESRQEQGHDVARKLPHGGNPHRQHPESGVGNPVVLQSAQAHHLEQPVQTGCVFILSGVQHPAPHHTGGDERYRHREQENGTENPFAFNGLIQQPRPKEPKE